MKLTNSTFAFAAVAGLLAPFATTGARADCAMSNVSVTSVGVTGNSLQVSLSGAVTGLKLGVCHLASGVPEPLNGYSLEACRSLHSLLTAAVLSQKRLEVTIRDAAHSNTDNNCPSSYSYGAWAVVPVTFVELK